MNTQNKNSMNTTNNTSEHVEASFIDDLKNTIKRRLNDYAGSSYYAYDLAYTLFEREKVDGSVLFSTCRTKEFIKANFDLFGYLVEYVKSNLEVTLNLFSEPEEAHVILMLEAAQSVLARLPFIDTNWNEEIELTPKNIKTICKQLDSVEISEEYLF